MSLLRDVLRKNNRRGIELPRESSPDSTANTKKNYATSIRSLGGASVLSVAGSVASFYSIFTGKRLPKRRRPDISRLGVPIWYHADPPPSPDIPGTERIDVQGPLIAAHGSSLQGASEDRPWLSVVLYNYGSGTSQLARYFNEATIQGELRLVLSNPKSIASLDVWCIGRAESMLELAGPPFLNMHANLWKRKKGDPRERLNNVSTPFKGNFPAGSYVFPFKFPALPRDIVLERADTVERDRVTRIALPPSYQAGALGGFKGNIRYYIGVNLKCDDITGVDEEYEVPFLYYQRARPFPREISPFPFIPTREDWPFRREALGGWTLTPFGGRGRFNEEVVEVEGILGVQTPEVYGAGQIVRFGLLLWSDSTVALRALSRPEAVDVVLIRSDLFGTDVLHPRDSSRRNRTLHRMSQGRIWRTEDGIPPDDGTSQLNPNITKSPIPEAKKKRPTAPTAHRSSYVSRFQQTVTTNGLEAVEEISTTESDSTLTHETEAMEILGSSGENEAPSLPLQHANEDDCCDTVRMDGDVHIGQTIPPSFRFKYMGCEYILQLTITHPEYSHISPSGPGIQAETPLSIVTDPAQELSKSPSQPHATRDHMTTSNLPITGKVADIGTDAIYAPCTLGEVTTKERPTWKMLRMSAF